MRLDRHKANRRRFSLTASVASILALFPFLWVLWGGARMDPLRRHPTGLWSNFFDLQARALFAGHFWIPKGNLGIEAFVIDGRDQMYFGPFPALLRMPVLALTDSADGRLTAPSMLLAWLTAAMFTNLLVWRLRVMLRDDAALGRAESTSLGAFIAAVLCGSSLLFLAAVPAVYYEAIAWGVALSLGSLFGLLGVLERPSIARVTGTAMVTTAAVLARSTVGWGCVVGLILTALWFALGKGGPERRRWSIPVLIAAFSALAVGCAVTWAKFGAPFAWPMQAQVYTRLSPNRRAFLRANDGQISGAQFLASNLLAYLRPDGLRIGPLYPFFTLPATPPTPVGNVVMDMTYRTPGIPASMTFLFFSALWGTAMAFRRGAAKAWRLMRIPILAGAAASAGVLLWGGIAARFTADFIPLLVIGGAAGMIDMWRRLQQSSVLRRGAGASAALFLLGIGVIANLGIAVETAGLTWLGDDLTSYLKVQQAVAEKVGGKPDVERGDRWPRTAPAGTFFVVGNCEALLVSTGEKYFPRWLPADGTRRRTFDVTYQSFDERRVHLATFGVARDVTLSVEERPIAYMRWIRFRVDGPLIRTTSRWIRLRLGSTYSVDVVTDLAQQGIQVFRRGELLLDQRGATGLPVTPVTLDHKSDPVTVEVSLRRQRGHNNSLCEQVTSQDS